MNNEMVLKEFLHGGVTKNPKEYKLRNMADTLKGKIGITI